MDRPEQNSSSTLTSVIVQEKAAMSTMQCKKCMAMLPEHAKYCSQCGRAVKDKAASAVHGAKKQNKQDEQDKHKRQISHYSFWLPLLKIVVSWFKRRVPPIRQLSEVECGAACLAMILSYYGRKTSVSEIRERCGVGRDGLSALSLVKAARSYGLRVRSVSLQDNDFRFVKLPAIIH